jgi:hypothetical protein
MPTTTQTQYFDMIAQFRLCQGQESRGKEHSLVIGMGNEQTDPLVPQSWEFRLRYRGGVKPGGDDDDEGENNRYPQHGDARDKKEIKSDFLRIYRKNVQNVRSS